MESKRIDRIVRAADLCAVIGMATKLRKVRGLWEGRCPFEDHLLSVRGRIVVSREHSVYFCRECGRTGNAVTFLTSYYDVTFEESINYLGLHFGHK